jgi:hypothetical protein
MIRVIRTAVLGALLGALVRFLMTSGSDASHPFGWVDDDNDGTADEHKHLLSITNYLPERYCVYKTAGNLTVDAYWHRIRDALELGDSSKQWNRLGSLGQLTVDISGGPSGSCPAGANISVLITGGPPFCEPGCANHYSYTNNTTTGHREPSKANVMLDWRTMEGSILWYRHVISHEFGHVFGLCHGGPTAPTPAVPGCGGPQYTICVPFSVMHDYGCPANGALEYPTDFDRASVYGLIPSATGGGGGGGRGCPFALPC